MHLLSPVYIYPAQPIIIITKIVTTGLYYYLFILTLLFQYTVLLQLIILTSDNLNMHLIIKKEFN